MAQRLLAALLVDAPCPVDRDTLIERLWGDCPPATATTALQVHVSHVRRALEPDHRRGVGSVLRTTGDGYALAVDRAQIDAYHFESLVHRAEERSPVDPQRALGDVEAARALWRGRPWGALQTSGGCVVMLCGSRSCGGGQTRCGPTCSSLGRHELIIDSLTAAVEEEPLRERRWEQLMLAQYRCGRQANALRGFQDARRVLIEELGIEPSPSLRALDQAVLVQDPSLAAPPRSVPERPRHNLPAPLTSLIGRSDDAAVTQKLLEASRLVTITGTGGCGKTPRRDRRGRGTCRSL